MHHALVLSLCVVAASPVAPSQGVEVEAAARAFRIESYNRCREDRERYQQLREADDDLRIGLAATNEDDLTVRQEQAAEWYREATAAVHADGDIPASPAWLSEALADAAAGKLREQSSATFASKKTSAKSCQTKTFLPPILAPAETAAETNDSTGKSVETPFFFVNAAIKALGGGQPNSPKVDEVQEPVIHPAGPIVDGRIEEPETATDKGSLREAAVTQPALQIEPKMELPTLGAESVEEAPVETPAIEMPEMELPELSTN